MKCENCGSKVGTFTRFCNSCGAPVGSGETLTRLDEEGIPIEERLTRTGSENFTVKAVRQAKPKSKKRSIAVIAVLFAAVLSIGIYFFINYNKEQGYTYSGDFVLMTKEKNKASGIEELYLGVPGKNVVKLADDAVNTFTYTYMVGADDSRKYIYISSDHCLYEVDEKGNKEKISDIAHSNYVYPSEDLKKYLFSAGYDRTLYIKYNNKEKEKIADNVNYYSFVGKKGSIAYTDDKGDLYKRTKAGKITKVDSNVRQPVQAFGEDDLLLYIKNDGRFYCESSPYGDVTKLTDSDPNMLQFTEDGDIFFQVQGELYCIQNKSGKVIQVAEEITNYIVLGDVVAYSNSNGEIFYTRLDEADKYKLSDKGDISIDNGEFGVKLAHLDNYILYIDNEGILYETKFGSEERKKLFDGVKEIYSDKEKAYFFTIGDVLYEIDKNGSMVKIRDDVKDVRNLGKLGLSYRTYNDKLYVDGKEYKDVIKYDAEGEDICYVNSKDELYIIKKGGQPQLVCSNAKEYSTIYYGGWYLHGIFRNDLIIN